MEKLNYWVLTKNIMVNLDHQQNLKVIVQKPNLLSITIFDILAILKSKIILVQMHR